MVTATVVPFTMFINQSMRLSLPQSLVDYAFNTLFTIRNFLAVHHQLFERFKDLV